MSLSHIPMTKKYITIALTILALSTVSSLQAGQRRFTFIYESATSPKGQFEFENWVTWKNGNESGNKVEFATKSNME
jgi:hypothetical protein